MGRKKGGGPAKPRGEAMPTREVPPCLSSALFVAGLIGLAAALAELAKGAHGPASPAAEAVAAATLAQCAAGGLVI
jgi:hypothetical protein